MTLPIKFAPMLFIAAFVLASCGGTRSTIERKATLEYWNQFVEVGKEAEAHLGKHPTRKQVAAYYSEAAEKFAALPTLHVDQSLVDLTLRFSANFRELGYCYDQIATRYEDVSFGVGKIIESFLGGVMGDPFGAAKADAAEFAQERARLEQIKGTLRDCVSELTALRVKLTAKYGVEFAHPTDL